MITLARSLSVLSVLALASLPGCASSDDVSVDGATELGESASELAANPNTGYFVVTRQDMRKCASPMCGGVFVKRANQALTRCADGTMQAECYTYGLELGALGLPANAADTFRSDFNAKHGVVRATVRSFIAPNDARIMTLRVSEAWKAAAEVNVTSTFYRIGDTGIRCITAPCDVVHAFTLNSRDSISIKSANLGTLGNAQERAIANAATVTKQGFLAAGSIAMPKCMPSATNCGPWFQAEEFYTPVTAASTGPIGCGGFRAGAGACPVGMYCSYAPADICGAADAPGTCAVKPTVCTKELAPVCGCGDQTFQNKCMAALAGVSVVSTGACK
jgi:Kazal-type serine protease inhibitor domain